MARPSKYPPEVRERAVRMVVESKGEYPSEFAAIRSIAAQAGDRLAGDAAQVGPSGRDRRRAAAGGDHRGDRRDPGAEEGESPSCAGPTRS